MNVFCPAAFVKPRHDGFEACGVALAETLTGKHQQGTVIGSGQSKIFSISKRDQSQDHGIQIRKLVEPFDGGVSTVVLQGQGGIVSVGVGKNTCHFELIAQVQSQCIEARRGKDVALFHLKRRTLATKREDHLRKFTKTRSV